MIGIDKTMSDEISNLEGWLHQIGMISGMKELCDTTKIIAIKDILISFEEREE